MQTSRLLFDFSPKLLCGGVEQKTLIDDVPFSLQISYLNNSNPGKIVIQKNLE